MADQMLGVSTDSISVMGEPLKLQDLLRYRATMIWDGYIYQRERTGKNRSWWRCRRNRPRDKEARMCMGRAVYKNQKLVITVGHSHGPETTNQNFVPSRCTQSAKKNMVAAVKGFVLSADQDLLQSEVTNVVKHHQCDLCEMKFAIARVLETHKMLEHQVCARWKCSECGMQFLQAENHNYHVRISHPYALVDNDLDSSSSSLHLPEALQDQTSVRFESSIEKQILDLETPVKETLIKAESSLKKHEDTSAAYIDSVVAASENNMNIKVGKSMKKRRCLYKCEYCTEEFYHPCKLKVHTRKHTGETPYKCTLCPRSFMSSSTRGAHIKNAHLKVRKHLCTWCGKKFTMPKTLTEHIRTHTGEKPYTCPFCSRQFSKKNAMVVHTRQHTGEKPYVCDQCGQSFTVNVSLRTHLKSKHNIIVDTGMQARQIKPEDNSIPAIGRPKRVEAEKQLIASKPNGLIEKETVHVTLKNVTPELDSAYQLENFNVFNTFNASYVMNDPASTGAHYPIPKNEPHMFLF